MCPVHINSRTQSLVSVYSSPITHTNKFTTINFSKSNVRDSLPALLSEFFTDTELDEHVNRFGSLVDSEPTLWLSTGTTRNPERIRIILSKKSLSPTSVKHLVKYRKINGEWMFYGVALFLLKGKMHDIARELGWERASFTDDKNKPSANPVFVPSREKEQIVITAPIVAMSDLEFCRSFKISKYWGK